MKKLTSSHDILYGQYNPSQDKEAEEQEQIHKKYGIFPYQNEYNSLSVYKKEAETLGSRMIDKKIQIINDTVSKIGGRAKKDWTGEDDEVRYKITSDESKQAITKPFLAHLEEYKEKLEQYTRDIKNSTTMKDADNFALQATTLHDKDFHGLEVECSGCLAKFEDSLQDV